MSARAFTLDDVTGFVRGWAKIRRAFAPSASLRQLGFAGDELDAFLLAFADRYAVDMTDYLWYFHDAGEGWSWLGQFVFKPPHRRVTYIPITITVLHDAANAGRWSIAYPEHHLPKRRWDVVVDRVFLGLALAAGSVVAVMKIFSGRLG